MNYIHLSKKEKERNTITIIISTQQNASMKKETKRKMSHLLSWDGNDRLNQWEGPSRSPRPNIGKYSAIFDSLIGSRKLKGTWYNWRNN